jgi:hypothetical protein
LCWKYPAAQALTLARLKRLKFYADAFGQSLYGLAEGEIFAHLDESEDATAGPAGETLEYLLGTVDVKAGPMVVVERAQADHFPTFLAQADVLAYNVDDVVCLLNLIDCRFVKHPWHMCICTAANPL